MNVEIDRLVLDVPGLTPEEGRGLAERIGAALARGPVFGPVDHVSVTVTPNPDLDVLAARIVAAVRGTAT